MKHLEKNSPFFEKLDLCFNILFGICFSFLFFNVVFHNHPVADTGFEYSPRPVIKSTVAWSLIVTFVYFLTSGREEWLKRNKSLALFGLILVSICIQLLFAYELEIESGGDVKAVYKGGVEWAKNQNLGYLENYFYVYPNNLGALFLFKNAHAISLLFSSDSHFLTGVVINLLSINISLILIFLISNKLWGNRTAFLSLILSLLCLPIYFYTPIFYTDTFSLPFLVLSLYLYILSRDTKKVADRLWLFVLIGLVIGIGMEIKFSVVICFAAMLLDSIWYGRFKQFALPFLVAAVTMASIKIAFNAYIYSNLLDKTIAYQKNLPYIHWIAMGIQGDGSFDNRVLEFTMSTPREERVSANLELIKNQLEEYGVKGYLRFLSAKGVYSFGSGVYGVYQILDDDPKNDSFLHQFALFDGKYFGLFNYACQGWHIVIFLFIIFSSFLDSIRRNSRDNRDQFLRFSIFGIYLFLLIWEANPRYIFNFIPVFILCATKGINMMFNHFSK